MLTPRIVLAGTHSGVGKTTISTGLMYALSRRGLPIQGYKVGPDYIDPTYHTLATGRPSRNLDRWLLNDRVRTVFEKNSVDHWAVIEGVMGLFDGMSGTAGYGSSADIAKILDAPVVLIVDAANMSRSVAALVHGFCTFDPELYMAGVILNRVRSSAQETLLHDALAEINVPILGSLPREEAIRLPERHLGLVPSQEKESWGDFWEELNRIITTYIDLDQMEEIMKASVVSEAQSSVIKVGSNKNIENYTSNIENVDNVENSYAVNVNEGIKFNETIGRDRSISLDHDEDHPRSLLRLGVARDEAFSFYYKDALEECESLGFSIVPFSPLKDLSLPEELDAIFIGGGFPEIYLERLSNNVSFLESLRAFSHSGKMIYAECGGYMYLGQSITDFEGNTYPMVGLIPIESEMTKKLQGMGYRTGIFTKDNFLGKAGTVVHTHEFHYSRAIFKPIQGEEESPAFELVKGERSLKLDGYISDTIVTSYLHLNFAGHPEIVRHWVESIRQGASL